MAPTASDPNRNYALVSTDGHCGADIDAYKPYLERRYHEQFDAWRQTFRDGWSYIDEMPDATRAIEGDILHVAATSFLSPVNWDSTLRQRCLESQGIVAEVLFPNTVPPFYPSGLITAAAPQSRAEYELRAAGIRAHNRWLVEFCSDVPGRRAGMAQIFVDDLDDSIKEVRWARDAGLSGIAMPSDHFRKLHQLHRPEYDRLWAVLEDIDMPVAFHGVLPGDPASDEAGIASPAIGLFEFGTIMQRAIHAMIFGGSLQRFPRLKIVVTEQQCAWLPAVLAKMDEFWSAAHQRKNFANVMAHDAMLALEKSPSDYFRSNYYVASFLDPSDTSVIDDLGYERIMWGADFPHHEGTYPYTTEALRLNFTDRPETEVRAMVSTTAAEVFGLDLALLQTVADEIGPSPSTIAKSLAEDEFPEDSMSPTFSYGFNVAGVH